MPVWFVRHDPVLTPFSRTGTAKVGHPGERPEVGDALDNAAGGTDVVTGRGHAALVGEDAAAPALPDVAADYGPLLGDQTVEQWRETFSLPVVTVERLVTWRFSPDNIAYRSVPEWRARRSRDSTREHLGRSPRRPEGEGRTRRELRVEGRS